ncbi:MAG: hypothetical protein V1779_14725 [bacterium]
MKYIIFFLIILNNQLISSDWKLINDFEGSSVKSITCTDSNNCFLLNQRTWYTKLYKSSNQGVTWDSVFQSDPFKEEYPFLVNAASGVSPTPDYYFIAMWDCAVLKKSTDGGKTFKRIYLDTCDYDYLKHLYEFTMYDTNYGFGESDDFLYITKDGWETFEKVQINSNQEWYYSPFFIDSNTIVMTYFSYAIRNLGKGMAFLKYNITKENWDTVSFFVRDSPDYEDIIESIDFVDDTLGYGCGWSYTENDSGYYDIIYKTTNGGYNWNRILKELNLPKDGLAKIKFHDNKNGVAAGMYKKIYITNDGGETWVLSEAPEKWNGISSFNIIWIGHHPHLGMDAFGGGLYRYEGEFFDFTPDTTDTTDIEEYIRNMFGEIEVNAHFYRSQLYISINDEHFRKYKLQICDIMGNVAMEQELSSGVGTLYVPYDISGLTSGAYLYMISCQGVVVKTGKLISITN